MLLFCPVAPQYPTTTLGCATRPPFSFDYGYYFSLRRRYLKGEYLDVKNHVVTGSVHVETDWASPDPFGEMEYVALSHASACATSPSTSCLPCGQATRAASTTSIGKAMSYQFDFSFLADKWPAFAVGAWLTIRLTVVSIALGFTLGTACALLRTYGHPLLRRLVGCYVWIALAREETQPCLRSQRVAFSVARTTAVSSCRRSSWPK